MVGHLVDDDIICLWCHLADTTVTRSCCSHRPDQSPMRVSTPVELSRPSQPRAPSIPSTVEILLSPTPQSPGAAAVPWRHVAPPQAREPQATQAREPQATQARVDLASPRPPPPAVMKKPTVAPVCLAQPTSIRFAAVYISMLGMRHPFTGQYRHVATLSLQTM